MKKSILVPVSILVAALVAAPVYKRVDEAGQVHYSDQPPPDDGAAEAEELILLPPPSDADVLAARGRLESLIAEQEASREARAAEQERRRLEQEFEEAQRIQRLRLCQRAQQNLHVLEIQRPVDSIDQHGEYVYVDDHDRESLMDAMRAEIEANCN